MPLFAPLAPSRFQRAHNPVHPVDPVKTALDLALRFSAEGKKTRVIREIRVKTVFSSWSWFTGAAGNTNGFAFLPDCTGLRV
jgi:hypothetical protein